MPLGIAAAIYLQEYARDTRLNRLLTTNIRNLAGVPSIVYGILGLVVFVQTLRSITGPDNFGRSYHLGRADAGGARRCRSSSSSRWRPCGRPEEHPRGGLRCRRDPVGGRAEPRAALRGSRHLHRNDPVARSCLRGDRPAAAGRRRHRLLCPRRPGARPSRSCRGKYTALPTQIFSWSRLAGDGWKANTAAAIIVLLAIILVVNLFAILLRNRYDRKW